MIPTDASNMKYVDNFIFVFATWICALRGKKKKVWWQKVDTAAITVTTATATSQAASSNS